MWSSYVRLSKRVLCRQMHYPKSTCYKGVLVVESAEVRESLGHMACQRDLRPKWPCLLLTKSFPG